MLCLNSKVDFNKKIEKFANQTEKELAKFFGVKLNSVWIMLLNSRQDIDAIYGKKTPDWLVGFTHETAIFILNPKVYTKESSHKNLKDFWKTLKHEYCHLYFRALAGSSYPKWLNEGLACYLAKQEKPALKLSEALYVLNVKQEGKYDVYAVGYLWVEILVEKFGAKKILTLLKALKLHKSRSEFGLIFYKVFKVKFDQKGLSNLYNSHRK